MEAVNQRTDNTIAKWKWTKGQQWSTKLYNNDNNNNNNNINIKINDNKLVHH